MYLNELDWELDKAGLRFVRYADDSIVMCRDEAELERAVIVVGEVMSDLGLELAEEKTYVVDAHGGSFDYLGFTFKGYGDHGRYFVSPSDASLAKFKSDVKAMTKKTYSKSFEQWAAKLNPVIRGKFNYFLAANRAARAVWEECRRRGMRFHGRAKRTYQQLDAYVRQRLRVNFANRGKRHAGQRDARLMTVKYGNDFFLKDMGLVSGQYMTDLLRDPTLSKDDFLALRKKKRKWRSDAKTTTFFTNAYAR